MALAARVRVVLGRARREQEGFSILEVLIAAFILVLGSLAILMTFASAIHNVQRSREAQISISVAQREMERVRVLPYESIRLESTPVGAASPATEPNNPYSRVAPIGEEAMFDVERAAGTPPRYEPLLVAEATEPPQALARVAVETPGVRAEDGTEVTVFRFITCELEADDGTCVAKRVVIDVRLAPKANLGNSTRSYKELQSTIVGSEQAVAEP